MRVFSMRLCGLPVVVLRAYHPFLLLILHKFTKSWRIVWWHSSGRGMRIVQKLGGRAVVCCRIRSITDLLVFFYVRA